MMTSISKRSVLTVAVAGGLDDVAPSRKVPAPTPWELKSDMGYAYGKDGKTFSYKMGTNNAGTLLKGAKKVPKGTLFFIGQNGQLYMRSGPYLEDDGTVHVRGELSGIAHGASCHRPPTGRPGVRRLRRTIVAAPRFSLRR